MSPLADLQKKTFIRGRVALSSYLTLEHLKSECPSEAYCQIVEDGFAEIIIPVTEKGAESVADGDLKDFLYDCYEDLMDLRKFQHCEWELHLRIGETHPDPFFITSGVMTMLAILQFSVFISHDGKHPGNE